jgi:hypothetical protein
MQEPSHPRTAQARSAQVNLELEASIERLLAARAVRQLKDRKVRLPFPTRRLTNGSDAARSAAES